MQIAHPRPDSRRFARILRALENRGDAAQHFHFTGPVLQLRKKARRLPQMRQRLGLSSEPEQHVAKGPQRLHESVGVTRTTAQLDGLLVSLQRFVDMALLQENVRNRHQVKGSLDRQKMRP